MALIDVIKEPHEVIWPKLQEVIESVWFNRSTSVESGNGVGKTWVAALIACAWLIAHLPSKVITSAPTNRQVKELLWSEIRMRWANIQRRTGYPGRILQMKIDIDEDYFALGFSARESADAGQAQNTFQGFHSPSLLMIFDEADGMHKAFWDAKEGVLTGERNHFLAIGNPIKTTGPFQDSIKSSLTSHIRISCLDHPNVIEGADIVPGCVTRRQVDERKMEWGENSPLYQSKILGIAPKVDEFSLFPLHLVEEAMDEEKEIHHEVNEVISMGVDVARFGGDKTVITIQHGMEQKEVVHYNGQDLNWTLRTVKDLAKTHMVNTIVVDDTGLGGGVTDGLSGFEYDGFSPTIVPVNFGGSPTSTSYETQFANIKAQMYYLFSQDIKGKKVKLLDAGRQKADLSNTRYKFDSKQRLIVEPKSEMKKRGLPSPDFADAAVLAHHGVISGKGGEWIEGASESDNENLTSGLLDKSF